MSGYVLLDTDVYSYLSRGDPRGDAFRGVVAATRPCLSFATVAELYKGAHKRGWGSERITALEADLRRYVVLGYDFALARTCGELLAWRESIGQRMEEFDAWIAATALRHETPLATNNRKHFEGIPDLRLVSTD